MKITNLRNNTLNNSSIDTGLTLLKASLKSINFPVEITEKITNKTFTAEYINNATGNGNFVVGEQILTEVDGTEDIAFLLFNNMGMNPQPLNPFHNNIKKGKATACQMCEQWYNGYPEVFRDFYAHEICHAMYFLLGDSANDLTHYQSFNPNYSQKPNIDWYLFIIKSLMPSWASYSQQPMYTYFKPTESTGRGHTVSELKPALMQLLDKARGIAGTPFKITSGFRTEAENVSVGGAEHSAHKQGLGADIACTDNTKRTLILKGLLTCGIPCFIEIARAHIHVDVYPNYHNLGDTMWALDD